MRSILLAVLFSAAPGASGAGVADHAGVSGAQRLFEAWLAGQMAYRGLPGVVAGVVPDQELIRARGCGFASLDRKIPMTPATKFRMASHSKLFTATAIQQLREAGSLGLDDPVSKHLPWFNIRPAVPDDPPSLLSSSLPTVPVFPAKPVPIGRPGTSRRLAMSGASSSRVRPRSRPTRGGSTRISLTRWPA